MGGYKNLKNVKIKVGLSSKVGLLNSHVSNNQIKTRIP